MAFAKEDIREMKRVDPERSVDNGSCCEQLGKGKPAGETTAQERFREGAYH